jgi:hypothetical protein
MTTGVAPRPVADRFWEKVDRRGPKECWPWLAGKNRWGYGHLHVGSKADFSHRLVSAHRLVYELVVGPIPEGLTIDHLCRNRACVNPAHLEPVTNRINILRGIGAAALHAKKTHCPQGHPYDEENTYIYPNGARYCRECNRIRGRKSYIPKKKG